MFALYIYFIIIIIVVVVVVVVVESLLLPLLLLTSNPAAKLYLLKPSESQIEALRVLPTIRNSAVRVNSTSFCPSPSFKRKVVHGVRDNGESLVVR